MQQELLSPDPELTDPDTLRTTSRIIAMSCAGFNLRRAARAVTQHFDHALAPCGLRTTQFTLLAAMALGGPVTTNELARVLVMDRTTLTRNVRLLREAGWVTSGPGRGGRELLFELSAVGRETLAAAIPIWREAQGGIEAAYGTAVWPNMVAELGRLVVGTLTLTPGEEPPPGLVAMMQARAASRLAETNSKHQA
jgi:DNA-binding MarR family transcriptional regulator